MCFGSSKNKTGSSPRLGIIFPLFLRVVFISLLYLSSLFVVLCSILGDVHFRQLILVPGTPKKSVDYADHGFFCLLWSLLVSPYGDLVFVG